MISFRPCVASKLKESGSARVGISHVGVCCGSCYFLGRTMRAVVLTPAWNNWKASISAMGLALSSASKKCRKLPSPSFKTR